MVAKLIIRLHADQTYDWLLTNDNQVIAEAYQQTELKLPENLENAVITVLVPTTDVTLLNVKLPKMKRAQLMRALPYAVEERLCQDVEALHFVPGQWQPGDDNENLLSVAIVSHEKMRAWLALCETVNIKPHQIIPDVFALPYLPQQWTCALEDQLLLLRTGQQTGMAMDIDSAQVILNQLIVQQKPANIVIENYNHLQTIELFAAQKDIAIKINTKPQPLLIQALNLDTSAINLLQGSYKSVAKKFSQPTQWRFTLQLSIAALVLIVITETAHYFSLQHTNARLQTQIATLSQQIHPGTTLDDQAKPRIEREIHLLNKLSKGNQFLTLISQLGKALKQSPGITIQQINYQNNLLSIRISAANTQLINQWTTILQKNNLNVIRINQATQMNTAELIIKGNTP